MLRWLGELLFKTQTKQLEFERQMRERDRAIIEHWEQKRADKVASKSHRATTDSDVLPLFTAVLHWLQVTDACTKLMDDSEQYWDRINNAIPHCNDFDELRDILEMTEAINYFLLGEETRRAIYERMLVLGNRDAVTLRRYSDYLDVIEKYDEAQQLLEEIADKQGIS